MINVRAMVALEDCMITVSKVPMNKKMRTDQNPRSVYRVRNSSICGFSSILGTASFKNCNPINNTANPMIKIPQFLMFSFFANVKANPNPTRGNAIALILTLKPRMVMSQAVMVVPILAPMITLIDSVKVRSEALAKLTTIRVVADEDWITDVIKNPVSIPKNLLEVMVARILRILFPASFIKASLITIIPKRNKPSEPNNCNNSVYP